MLRRNFRPKARHVDCCRAKILSSFKVAQKSELRNGGWQPDFLKLK